MDPTNRGSEEFHDAEHAPAQPQDDAAPKRRSPREAAPAPDVPGGQGPVRVVQLVSGDYLLTVNPVDGSEIEPCPPGSLPARPERHGPEQRAELRRAAAPPPPARQAGPRLPLLHRAEERERLGRLLTRGRSVRLTGPAGSGRSALLDALAEDCEGLAPDGVVRLNGHRRSATDLLHELFTAVHHAPLHRLDRAELLAAVSEIGAVVVLDDLEFGGSALDELLDATPECAFLFAATPDVPAPSADSHVEEVFLGGLDRTGCLELLEHAVGRALTDEEANWAADLWFESEGLPLRFVQAGALLRQRDALAAAPCAVEEFGVFAERPYANASASGERDAAGDAGDGAAAGIPDETAKGPLPTLAQAAAPAPLLASRLDEAARQTLRFAVALGGAVPHQAHLPALVGDTHADAAIGELLACGLLTTVGAHYRLATGVAEQLLAEYGEDWATEAAAKAHTAAQHYAWWAGHPSVTPERIAHEADTVLAALGALTGDAEAPHRAAAVLLARTAAPAFAAALHWGAWERSLRYGQEAARLAGEVGEEAYFHHELGVLALCTGNLDRARAELEASIGLRGVLADKRGAVAGRRALALVADRSGLAAGTVAAAAAGRTGGGRTGVVPPLPPLPHTPPGEEVPAARSEQSAAPPATPGAGKVPGPRATDETTAVIKRMAAMPGAPAATAAPGGTGPVRRTWLHRITDRSNRRNLAAAGAGAVLAAVLAAVVTLGAASGGDAPRHPDTVKPGQSASQQDGDGGLDADEPDSGGAGGGGQVPARKARPGETPGEGPGGTTATPGPSTPSGGADPSPSQGTPTPTAPSGTPGRPSPSPSRTPGGGSQSPKPTPSTDPQPTKSGGGETKPTPPTQPTTPSSGVSTSASGPAPSGKSSAPVA
ncbi:ATP-binding protein [Streptomyces sp. NPDC049585]|uniref:ATP-binding protein n=1 Tax=Streptomyces sp. NPDC049585 TaxID=3155154 RepID=UPI0034370A84